ncbi:MAG: type II secretion system protein [Patescibacteria group bacterium]
MNIKTKRQRGFTLIELLVVVAIIGMLASTVLIGLTPARKMGRDARRTADLRNVQNVLELFYSQKGAYPNSSSCLTGSAAGGTAGKVGWDALGSCLGTPPGADLLKKLPNDPSTTAGDSYDYMSDGRTYVMRAKLENPNNDVLKDSVKGTVSGLSCDGTFYCVVNP